MTDRAFKTTTKVSVTVQVEAGVYGPEWKIEDIRKQAEREGINIVSAALRRDPLGGNHAMHVVNSAVVSVTITEAIP